MKKLLLSAFAAFCAMGASAATEVVFDFDNNATALFGIEGRSSGSNNTYVADGEFNENKTATIDGVSVTVEASPADANTRNRLWATSPVLRMYNGTLTVSAPDNDVTKIVFSGNSNFNMTASSGTLEGKVWTATESVTGVVFTITKNTQLKSMTVTLDGEIGGDTPVVEIAGTGEGTEASPYDVERALSIIANEAQTTDNVYIAGTISNIQEVNLDYGNATYTIAQGEKSILVYRGKGLNGAVFTSADEIAVNDVVVLKGVLKDFNGTPEITGSSIVSINGESGPVEPPYTTVGDGTKDNPYTVEDIQHLNIETSDGNTYWVKGYILGSATSATKLNEPDKAVDTNIALGQTAESTTFIPCGIPATGDLRSVLGVATNPGNVGREVKVCGTLEKYFLTAGVKNVSDYEFLTPSGITGIDAENGAARFYNIQGIEVANPTAGNIYIRVINGNATKVIIR